MVRIPQRQTDAQLRALLEPYKDAQLLHLSTTEGAFGRFEDREQGQRFQVGGVGAATSHFFEAVRKDLIQWVEWTGSRSTSSGWWLDSSVRQQGSWAIRWLVSKP